MKSGMLENVEVIPVGDFYYCERKTFLNTDLILPGDSAKSPAHTLLVIKKIGEECKYGKEGDIILSRVLAKIGTITLEDKEFVMISEQDVGLLLRRK